MWQYIVLGLLIIFLIGNLFGLIFIRYSPVYTWIMIILEVVGVSMCIISLVRYSTTLKKNRQLVASNDKMEFKHYDVDKSAKKEDAGDDNY